jgi:hypothetical protein
LGITIERGQRKTALDLVPSFLRVRSVGAVGVLVLLVALSAATSGCGEQTSCDACRNDCPAGTHVAECDPNARPSDTSSCRCAEDA